MRMILNNRKATFGLSLIVFFLVLAVLGGPILSLLGKSATKIDYAHFNASPSGTHWLGTTAYGQDVFGQIVKGASESVFVGLLAALFSLTIATTVGLLSAYVGGWVDVLLNGAANVWLSITGFPLLLVIASYVPNVGIVVVAFVIAICMWPGPARQIRAQVMSIRNREFVAGMRMAGESSPRLLLFEVLPHIFPLLSSLAIMSIAGAVLNQASLAFFGIGTTTVSWGEMMSQVQNNGAIAQGEWWWFIPPGLCIVLLCLGPMLLNGVIEEISNPRLRGLDPKVLRRVLATQKRIETTGERATVVGVGVDAR